MTREEAVVEMGVDSSSIPAGLGTGQGYVRKWVDDVKSEETKYTSWWNTELKKREEMEVTASVRAASRSIQARKLLRERESARGMAADAEQAAANTVIGRGSLPAGWAEEAAAKKAARELEAKAAEGLKDVAKGAHGSAGAFREVMVMIREVARGDLSRLPVSFSKLLSMIGLSIPQMMGLGVAAAEVGAILYEMHKMDQAVAEQEQSGLRNGEFARKQAKELKVHVGDMERVGKITHEEGVKLQKILDGGTLDRNSVVMKALREHGGVVTKHDADAEARADKQHGENIVRNAKEAMNADEHFIMSGTKMLILKEEMAKLDRTGIEYKLKQLDLDEVEKDHLEAQKQLLQQNAEAQQKINSAQEVYDRAKDRLEHREERERDKFLPTLNELAHHGVFGHQARAIGRLDRRIKRELEFGNVSGADRDIASRNRLYDSLADRGVAAERADRFEVKELTAKMQKALSDIAEGKKAIKIVPQLK
jgi:hypothetical protein